MLASPLPSSLLDIYSLSMSSLGCKVLWNHQFPCSLVYFKNGHEYLTKGTTRVFISCWRFLQKSLVERNFLHVCHYGPVFSNLLLPWMLLFLSPDLCQPQSLLQVLAIFKILFIYSVSIRSFLFSHFTIFFSFLHSLCILHQRVGRIFCRYFRNPVLFVLFGIFMVSFEFPFFYRYISIYFFQLCCQTYLLLSLKKFFFFFLVFSFHCFCVFFPFWQLRLLSEFLYLSF